MSAKRLQLLAAVHQVARTNLTPCTSGAVRHCSTAAAVTDKSDINTSSNGMKLLQQRYASMLERGVLKPDQHQQQLVQELGALLQQLESYSSNVADYRVAREAYEACYQQRLTELKAADDLKEQQQQQTSSSNPTTTSSTSWLQRLLISAGFVTPKPQGPTPQQRARQAAAARAAAVVQELGPGPQPPTAPQGLYVYGSVGSGKSLLMDMFYDIARQHVQLDHSRRMHFNAAMLELHSRLHHLDVKQQQRQQRRKEAAAAAAAMAAATPQLPTDIPAAAAPSAAGGCSGGCGGSGHCHDRNQNNISSHPQRQTAAAAAAAEVVAFNPDHHHHQDLLLRSPSAAAELSAAAAAADHSDLDLNADHSDLDHHNPDPDAGCNDESASDAQVSAWFDDGIFRQKEAKAAVLAIRRHLREARAGRVPEARLAAANASVMLAAARSFIRAGSSDPNQGWTTSSSSSSKRDRVAALLCFDEMQISDVWSAAALKALLESLTSEGCVIVTTSNRHPADLPRHGLHEAMFGHFLNTLFSSCRLFELSSREDYRRLSLNAPATRLLQQPIAPSSSSSSSGDSNNAVVISSDRLYFWPLSSTAEAALRTKWSQTIDLVSNSSSSCSGVAATQQAGLHLPLSGFSTSSSNAVVSGLPGSNARSSTAAAAAVVPVMFGRQLPVSRCASGVAWFEFPELCGRPLGAADYLAVAQNYHTVFISGIPSMSMNIRDQARRFITLIDELYNARVLLVCSAAVPPDQLFSGTEGEEPLIDLEGLQFEGAVEGSRLRRDLMADGGVAPVAATATAVTETTALLGGMEEKFAFSRAVSRLYEMQSPLYAAARPRC